MCRAVLDMCGERTHLDLLNTDIQMARGHNSPGISDSNLVNSSRVHSLLTPCISNILIEYLNLQYGKKSKTYSRVRLSHFREAVGLYSKYNPIIKLFWMLLSQSDLIPPVPISYDTGDIAGDGAYGNCQNTGVLGDDGDEKIIFLLMLDCRQWMLINDALVRGSPIRREPFLLSGSHPRGFISYTDPFSSSVCPSVPTTQLIKR